MRDSPTLAEAIIREKIKLEGQADAAALGKEFGQIIQRHAKLQVNGFVHSQIAHYARYIFPG